MSTALFLAVDPVYYNQWSSENLLITALYRPELSNDEELETPGPHGAVANV
jgi:hypothetical protein